LRASPGSTLSKVQNVEARYGSLVKLSGGLDVDVRNFFEAASERIPKQMEPCVTASISNIRPFRPADLTAMQQVRQAAFRPVFQSFRTIVGDRIFSLALAQSDSEQAQLLEDLCSAGSNHLVLVATIGEAIVGFVSFSINASKRTGEIGLNAVHPDHAGQGIGTSMYAYAMVRMKECGAELATVSTGGDSSHAPARRAYEKAGFGPALPSVCLYKVL
jgi:ribosomal protein S18 acetylase RimI-like enzyme